MIPIGEETSRRASPLHELNPLGAGLVQPALRLAQSIAARLTSPYGAAPGARAETLAAQLVDRLGTARGAAVSELRAPSPGPPAFALRQYEQRLTEPGRRLSRQLAVRDDEAQATWPLTTRVGVPHAINREDEAPRWRQVADETTISYPPPDLPAVNMPPLAQLLGIVPPPTDPSAPVSRVSAPPASTRSQAVPGPAPAPLPVAGPLAGPLGRPPAELAIDLDAFPSPAAVIADTIPSLTAPSPAMRPEPGAADALLQAGAHPAAAEVSPSGTNEPAAVSKLEADTHPAAAEVMANPLARFGQVLAALIPPPLRQLRSRQPAAGAAPTRGAAQPDSLASGPFADPGGPGRASGAALPAPTVVSRTAAGTAPPATGVAPPAISPVPRTAIETAPAVTSLASAVLSGAGEASPEPAGRASPEPAAVLTGLENARTGTRLPLYQWLTRFVRPQRENVERPAQSPPVLRRPLDRSIAEESAASAAAPDRDQSFRGLTGAGPVVPPPRPAEQAPARRGSEGAPPVPIAPPPGAPRPMEGAAVQTAQPGNGSPAAPADQENRFSAPSAAPPATSAPGITPPLMAAPSGAAVAPPIQFVNEEPVSLPAPSAPVRPVQQTSDAVSGSAVADLPLTGGIESSSFVPDRFAPGEAARQALGGPIRSDLSVVPAEEIATAFPSTAPVEEYRGLPLYRRLSRLFASRRPEETALPPLALPLRDQGRAESTRPATEPAVPPAKNPGDQGAAFPTAPVATTVPSIPAPSPQTPTPTPEAISDLATGVPDPAVLSTPETRPASGLPGTTAPAAAVVPALTLLPAEAGRPPGVPSAVAPDYAPTPEAGTADTGVTVATPPPSRFAGLPLYAALARFFAPRDAGEPAQPHLPLTLRGRSGPQLEIRAAEPVTPTRSAATEPPPLPAAQPRAGAPGQAGAVAAPLSSPAEPSAGASFLPGAPQGEGEVGRTDYAVGGADQPPLSPLPALEATLRTPTGTTVYTDVPDSAVLAMFERTTTSGTTDVASATQVDAEAAVSGAQSGWQPDFLSAPAVDPSLKSPAASRVPEVGRIGEADVLGPIQAAGLTDSPPAPVVSRGAEDVPTTLGGVGVGRLPDYPPRPAEAGASDVEAGALSTVPPPSRFAGLPLYAALARFFAPRDAGEPAQPHLPLTLRGRSRPQPEPGAPPAATPARSGTPLSPALPGAAQSAAEALGLTGGLAGPAGSPVEPAAAAALITSASDGEVESGRADYSVSASPSQAPASPPGEAVLQGSGASAGAFAPETLAVAEAALARFPAAREAVQTEMPPGGGNPIDYPALGDEQAHRGEPDVEDPGAGWEVAALEFATWIGRAGLGHLVPLPLADLTAQPESGSWATPAFFGSLLLPLHGRADSRGAASTTVVSSEGGAAGSLGVPGRVMATSFVRAAGQRGAEADALIALTGTSPPTWNIPATRGLASGLYSPGAQPGGIGSVARGGTPGALTGSSSVGGSTSPIGTLAGTPTAGVSVQRQTASRLNADLALLMSGRNRMSRFPSGETGGENDSEETAWPVQITGEAAGSDPARVSYDELAEPPVLVPPAAEYSEMARPLAAIGHPAAQPPLVDAGPSLGQRLGIPVQASGGPVPVQAAHFGTATTNPSGADSSAAEWASVIQRAVVDLPTPTNAEMALAAVERTPPSTPVNSAQAQQAQAAAPPDLDELAENVYDIIRRRLVIERERDWT